MPWTVPMDGDDHGTVDSIKMALSQRLPAMGLLSQGSFWLIGMWETQRRPDYRCGAACGPCTNS